MAEDRDLTPVPHSHEICRKHGEALKQEVYASAYSPEARI